MSSRTTSIEIPEDLSRELLREGRKIRVSVRGTSMYPALKQGDVILVEPVKSADLKVGMVVSVRLVDAWVAHRIVKISQNRKIWTRGDFYRKWDTPVSQDQVPGVVVMRWHRGKTMGNGDRVRKISPSIVSFLRPLYKMYVRLNRKISR